MSPLRVCHVPDAHLYVRQVSRPCDGRPLPRFDWDDDPSWVRRHAADFDVLHVHFGFERYPVDRLAELFAELRAADRPLVWTAHDLSNPHLVDQGPHEAQLALLAEHASVVLTLTRGAADEIERRWGRHAVVVDHPHLAPAEVMARPRPSVDRSVVGVDLGMLRPSTDPRVVPALLDVLDPPQDGDDRGDTVLQVRLREEVLDPAFPRPDDVLHRLLLAAADDGRIDLRVGGRRSDAQLWDDLAGLSVLVLPYRWGSHSGWVESCHDVGTPVVAPELGWWGEQQAVHGYRTGADGPDRVSLATAVRTALANGPRTARVLDERLAERERGVVAHDRLHRLAVAGGPR